MNTLTVVLGIFFFIRLLLRQVPILNYFWWLDIVAVVGLVMLASLHTAAIRGVLKRRKDSLAASDYWESDIELALISERDLRLLGPWLAWLERLGEKPLAIWRPSAIELLHIVPWALLAWACMGASVFLIIAYPSIPIAWGSHQIADTNITIPAVHFAVNVWWLPLLLALRFTYNSASIWQKWKWLPIYVLTKNKLVQRYQESVLFPELGLIDVEIPTQQIVQVSFRRGYLGGIFGGYGDLTIERQISPVKDSDNEQTFHNMPCGDKLAAILREISPAGGKIQPLGFNSVDVGARAMLAERSSALREKDKSQRKDEADQRSGHILLKNADEVKRSVEEG